MSNRTLLLIITSALYLLCISCTAKKEAINANTKPNFIFLFADDLSYKAINALGNSEIKTPNIDKIARKGTVFTNTYNMGGWNGAICVASRAMIISGRSLWKVHDYKTKWQNKDPDALKATWPKLLEMAGYETYMTGKWHVDAPADSVFQTVRHVRPGMPKDLWKQKDILTLYNSQKENGNLEEELVRKLRPKGYLRPLDELDKSWEPSDKLNGGFWKGGVHWSEVVKNDAIDFINMAKVSEKPFFMYLAFNAPHDPRQAPKEFVDMYNIDDIDLPANWLPENPYKDDIGNTLKLRDEALAPFPRTEYSTKVHIKEYYAIISHLDQQVGRIIEHLEQKEMMDNTYIIFSADHGLAVGRHGFLGKQNLFDHSIRPPFILMGPKVPGGQKNESSIYLQDIMPTTLELAGVEVPPYVDFKSLRPLIENRDSVVHYESVYGAYMNLQRMVKKDQYKLIVYPNIDKLLLFNTEEDPDEIVDISKDPKNRELLTTLLGDLFLQQKAMNDELDLGRFLDLI